MHTATISGWRPTTCSIAWMNSVGQRAVAHEDETDHLRACSEGDRQFAAISAWQRLAGVRRTRHQAKSETPSSRACPSTQSDVPVGAGSTACFTSACLQEHVGRARSQVAMQQCGRNPTSRKAQAICSAMNTERCRLPVHPNGDVHIGLALCLKRGSSNSSRSRIRPNASPNAGSCRI